jgi:hypothetical protein
LGTWTSFNINHLYVNLATIFVLFGSADRVLERDGLEGSFGIFGMRASHLRMPNVPESEGLVSFDNL